MKITSKTEEKELLCKYMLLEKNPIIVKCQLTKLSCCLGFETQNLGYHIFEIDLPRCHKYESKNKKKRRKV